jgi:protein TonB
MTATRLDEMIFTRVVSDELSERAGARAPRHAWHRARTLPALGMPAPRRRRRIATAVSIALHILLAWLLIKPPALANLNPDLKLVDHGNAGNGIAGGGGGGTRGTGGVKFVQVAPPPQPAPPVAAVVPPIQPKVELPKPVEPVLPALELPKPATAETKSEIKVESPVVGIGGGVGNDGTKGNGPGSGGGIGNGIGTGTGSGTGPGTGAGKLDYIECKSLEMPIFPLPTPANVKGFKLIVNFDVDETGKILKFQFTPTRNGDYNRRIDEILRKFKLKPATTLQGVPIRHMCQFAFDFG